MFSPSYNNNKSKTFVIWLNCYVWNYFIYKYYILCYECESVFLWSNVTFCGPLRLFEWSLWTEVLFYSSPSSNLLSQSPVFMRYSLLQMGRGWKIYLWPWYEINSMKVDVSDRCITTAESISFEFIITCFFCDYIDIMLSETDP